MSEKSNSVQSDAENIVNLTSSFSHRSSREQIQSRYGDLIDSLPIIIYIAEPHPPYAPIYVSKGIEMLGYSQEEWNNSPELWVSKIHEDDRERILEETGRAVRQKRQNEYEYRLYAPDGTFRWFYDKGHFVHDENDEPVTWEGFLLDITERKLLEEDEKSRTADKIKKQSVGKTILLVEDEDIVREIIYQILSANDYRVITAENGLQALKICETGEIDFDLIITDLNMPQMNGREMVEKIKAASGEKKVLYISGYTDDQEFVKHISDLEQNFLAKPFSPVALIARVKEIIGAN